MNMYLVKDKLTNKPAGVPFFAETDAAAVRNVLTAFKDNMDTSNQFDLYYIASFDIDYNVSHSETRLICNLSTGKEFINNALKKGV